MELARSSGLAIQQRPGPLDVVLQDRVTDRDQAGQIDHQGQQQAIEIVSIRARRRALMAGPGPIMVRSMSEAWHGGPGAREP